MVKTTSKTNELNAICLDTHPSEDSRIGRYLQHMIQSEVEVYRLNFNFYSEQARDATLPSMHGEKCARIDFFDQFNAHGGILKRALNSRCLLGGALVLEAERAFKVMGLDARRPTVIHCHDPILLPLAANLAKAHRNWRLVYDRHELYEDSHTDSGVNVATALEKISRKRISGVVVVSDEHIDVTRRRFPGADVVSVPNYPSAKDYDENIINYKINSLDDDTKVVISYIGSLDNSFDRDIDLMLRIGEEAAATGRARFLIGGRANDARIEQRMRGLSRKFPDDFSFLGYVQRKRTVELTARSHIGLYLMKPDTCYWVKCSPNKVFEYLICGTVPVIRADVDRAREISSSSLLFDRNAGDDEIVDKVLSLISDKERLKFMMKSTREQSKNFTLESVAGRYTEIYRTVMKSVN
jgi:glycosyltransferase involved in cell wall biosynthesis